MSVPRGARQRAQRLAALLFTLAVIFAFVPIGLVVVALSASIYVSGEALLVIVPGSAAAAFVLALAGLLLLRRSRIQSGHLDGAVTLLGINLPISVAGIVASYMGWGCESVPAPRPCGAAPGLWFFGVLVAVVTSALVAIGFRRFRALPQSVGGPPPPAG